MTRQELGHFAAIAIMLQHTNGKRLGFAQHQPALEWRENRARCLLYETKLLSLLLARADNHSAQAVAMAVEELGGRVDDHVGAECNRLLKIRRHESVVHHELDFLVAADF